MRASSPLEIVLEALGRLGLVALEQVPVGVGHVGRRVSDVVANPLEREAGARQTSEDREPGAPSGLAKR